jgi:hypothetical protein
MPKLPILVLCSILCGCGQVQTAGGAGTDAGNAVTVVALRPDGTPAALARVEVRPADRTPASASEPPVWTGTTDTAGHVSFEPGPGSWSVLVRQGERAFRLDLVPGSRASDTLRTCAKVTGFLPSRSGGRLGFQGLGISVPIDPDGFFRAESLPSGALSWVARSGTDSVGGSIVLPPGATAVADTGPAAAVVDTLLDGPAPGSGLSPGGVPDTGTWSLAMSLRRSGSTDTAWFLAWDTAGSGIRVGALAGDTLVLWTDGNWRKIAGLPVAGPDLRVGVRVATGQLDVFLDGSRVIGLAGSTPSDRSGWGSFRLGPAGIAAIHWTSTRTGAVSDSWFDQSP